MQEVAQSWYHWHGGKEKKQINIMIITKRDCQNKHETNIKNYLMKKKYIKREYGRKRYGSMPKKLKEYQKNYCKAMKTWL